MAEKDITEKTLADYNDVFADIVNVLLFDGEEVVHENDLEPVKTRSQYKADTGRVHEQERDVSKKIRQNGAIISLVGFENQTQAEALEPVRLMGYDGASYRSQLLDKKVKRVYPVITMVLYFGTEHWSYSHHLMDVIDIPDRFRPFVSDYEMKNLFEISYLSMDQVEKFKSDFRLVAEYFVQTRTNEDYHPSDKVIEHVDAFLKLMSVLTGDNRYETELPSMIDKQKAGQVHMNDLLDRTIRHAEARGEKRGEARGEARGVARGETKGAVKVYITKLHYTPQQISQEIDVPEDTINEIIKELQQEKEEKKRLKDL